MAYERYFQIRQAASPHTARDIPHAPVSLGCTLAGRERGGLCDIAEAVLPARWPDAYGIRPGDFFVCGHSSNPSKHWFHGYVEDIQKGGPGSTQIRVAAQGLEWQLKSIYPRVNFGAERIKILDPNSQTYYEGSNPYTQYDNPSLTQVSSSTGLSIVRSLWDGWIKGKIVGVGAAAPLPDLDTNDAGVNIEFMAFDGSASLYEILTSLAERCGMTWGFWPTATAMDGHQLFFKSVDSVLNPNATGFEYGRTCSSIESRDTREVVANTVTIVGGRVPKIGRTFSREFRDQSSLAQYGPVGLTRSAPGLRRTVDTQRHAKAVLERRGNPVDTFDAEVFIRDGDPSGAGELMVPGKTRIRLASSSGRVYNPALAEQLTSEINVVFDGHRITCSMKLGEEAPSDSELGRSAILDKGQNATAKAAFDFTSGGATEFTLDEDSLNPADRVEIVTLTGIVEEKDDATNLGTVRIIQDTLGGSDQDVNRERLTDIPVPSSLNQGDFAKVENVYQDDELQEIAVGELSSDSVSGGGVNSDQVIAIVRHALAVGNIPIYNTTPVKDIQNYTPTGTDDANLLPGNATYAEAKVGHLARVPAGDRLALNAGVHMIRATDAAGIVPDFNTPVASLVLPSNWDDAKLLGQVLGITGGGVVALGYPVGGNINVIVRTGTNAAAPMYLVAAVDPVFGNVAAPLGTRLQGNSSS